MHTGKKGGICSLVGQLDRFLFLVVDRFLFLVGQLDNNYNHGGVQLKRKNWNT